MPYVLNVIYLIAIAILSPWLVYKSVVTGKLRRGWGAKLLGCATHPLLHPPAGRAGPCVWFHGVSVGEIHLLRQVVAAWRCRRPGDQVVVSTTTDTGYDEARKCFADMPVIYWPFDFSWAVRNALGRIDPDLVVLAESEVWPNFMRLAKGRGVKLALINGRMSPRSAARYGKVRWLVQGLFGRLDTVAAQTEEYAAHFRSLGARHVVVTGSVKYDGAQTERSNPKTQAMRKLLGVGPDELVWVAGSTQAPEEEITLGIYRKARERFAKLRLILVPRQKDRFEEVARLLERSGVEFVRRSALGPGRSCETAPIGNTSSERAVILVDTIGELSAIWGLADVAFVGGSLDGHRGGQNMIEPAAYGAAVLIGPHTWNFKDTVARLKERQAAWEVADAAALEQKVLALLADSECRARLGAAAQAFVIEQQGATARTIDLLGALVSNSTASQAA